MPEVKIKSALNCNFILCSIMYTYKAHSLLTASIFLIFISAPIILPCDLAIHSTAVAVFKEVRMGSHLGQWAVNCE